MLITPHGGRLINRLVEEIREDLPKKLVISQDVVKDIYNIGTGVYSPLEGFLGEKDFKSVLEYGRLSSGLAWTIPIVLDVKEVLAKDYKIGDKILLIDESKTPVGVLYLEEKYKFKKDEFAKKVYGTLDARHPGVKKVMEMGDVLFSGKVDVSSKISFPLKEYFIPPIETRRIFKERGWQTVVGFQTRNAPHTGHEFLQKTALSFLDGLFINPVIGRKKPGDFRDEVIIKTYEVLIENYYPKDRVVLGILPMEMRYAGPREAIHHAILRKNFGCTHILIGRDHAGVGNFYDPFAAHRIFNDYPDIEIKPLFFKTFFYCKKCGSIMNEKTCPHKAPYRVDFSGTMIRKFFEEGKKPPKELLREEVAEVILKEKNPFVT